MKTNLISEALKFLSGFKDLRMNLKIDSDLEATSDIASRERHCFNGKMSDFKRLVYASVITLIAMSSFSKAAEEADLTGRVEMRTVNCFDDEPHDHENDIEYFVTNDSTHVKTRIIGNADLLKKLEPDIIVRVKGDKNIKAKDKAETGGAVQSNIGAANSLAEVSVVEADSVEILAYPAADFAAPDRITAASAPTLKMLSCLLVFASSTDFPCMTSETNARNLLFNNVTNANLAMQSLTKGFYGLQLGNGDAKSPVVNMSLNVSSVGKSSKDMETLILAELVNLGYTKNSYNRLLLFPPGGITDRGFTAYAYLGAISNTGNGRLSVYGSSYGNSRMNGYLHELGHNFGFTHSSKGGSEYGDRTCVMGLSNDATETENYNVVKVIDREWLNPFPGTHVEVSSDSKLNLYSLHIDPITSPGAMAVSIPGTPYYVAYRIDSRPYAKLSQPGDRDRVFVYSRSGPTYDAPSYQVANLAPGQIFEGAGTRVIFEKYGSANSYASVLFDVADANAIPYAAWQSVSIPNNRTIPITLAATDPDENPLNYAVVSNPPNGTLTGSAPNLIYTPNEGFVGKDTFTFKANDGTVDSNVAEIAVTVNAAITPMLALADDGMIAEANENGEVINITLSEDTFVPTLNPANWSISNQPAGVSIGILTRTSDTTATLSLSGNRTGDYYFDIANFTITVNAAEFTTWSSSDVVANSGVTFIAYNAPPSANAGMDQSTSISGSGQWTPAEIPTLAWYDAADTASLTLVSGNVSQWNDKSGNGRVISQATSGHQPSFASETVSFDGVDDSLYRSGAFMYANGSVDIYVAGAFSNGAASRRFVTEVSSTNGSVQYSPFQNRNNSNRTMMSAYMKNDQGTLLFSDADSYSTAGAFDISIRKIYQASDSGASMAGRVDGGDLTTTPYTRSGTMTLTSFGLGGIIPNSPGGTGSFYMRGDLNEIVIVPGQLGDPARKKIEGYLAHKWNLSANLPAAHPYKTDAPSASKAVVNLTGTASDPESQALIATWSVVSGPAGASIVNPASLSTIAEFSQVGEYVLRLTVSDGYSSVSDDITVTVIPPSGTSYSVWTTRTFANPFTNTAKAADPDEDGMSNLMEYAMGTDPTSSARGALKADGTAHGSPIIVPIGAGDTFDFVFIRRDDHGTSGGANYTPQFSADLQTFYDSTVIPTVIADSVVDPDYEVVKVPYPAILPDGKKASFGRLQVTGTP